MIRTVFAMAVAALVFAAVSGTSQATPIAPLPAGVAAGSSHGNVTQAHYYYYHRRHYYYHRRHCWRGRWGRLHCGW